MTQLVCKGVLCSWKTANQIWASAPKTVQSLQPKRAELNTKGAALRVQHTVKRIRCLKSKKDVQHLQFNQSNLLVPLWLVASW